MDLSTLQPEVLDIGADVLLARVTLPDGRTLEGIGHVSATTNFYDEKNDKRDEDGHRSDKAKARTMTAAEVGAYALELIVAQNADVLAQARPIEFELPDAGANAERLNEVHAAVAEQLAAAEQAATETPEENA